METNFASKGVAGAGLGLGIAGTALAVLGGGLGNVLGGNAHKKECPAPAPSAADAMIPALVSSMLVNGASRVSVCNEDHNVNRYESTLQGRIAELETEVKLRDANTFTMGEVNKLRDYVERRLDGVEGAINAQAVVNAQVTANISCMQTAIAALQGLTKTVIPIANICPIPEVATPTTTTTG